MSPRGAIGAIGVEFRDSCCVGPDAVSAARASRGCGRRAGQTGEGHCLLHCIAYMCIPEAARASRQGAPAEAGLPSGGSGGGREGRGGGLVPSPATPFSAAAAAADRRRPDRSWRGTCSSSSDSNSVLCS